MADYDKLIKGVEGEIQAIVKRMNDLIEGRKEIMERGNAEIDKINGQLDINGKAKLQLQGQIQAYQKLKNEKTKPRETTVKKKKKER